MKTESVLTDELIFALVAETDIASIDPKIDVLMFSRDEMLKAGRDIEQAVLQSTEIQAMRKDAERLKKACRIAVLALAHAHKDRGEVYRLAYEEVDAAIRETQP